MVEIPRVPRRFITTDTPQSSLTRGDIEAPYNTLSRVLNETGDALSDIAVTHAEDAGTRAVTRGADGQLQVETVPVVGRAATPYARAVKVAAMTHADGSADRDLIGLREQFQNDPEGFNKAAAAYRDEKVKQLTGTAGPAVGLALQKSIESTTTQVYRGLLAQKQSLDLRRASGAIDAGITTTGDEMETLARKNGIGPDYDEKLAKLDALLAEKVNNPLFAFSREQADAYRDGVITRVQGAAVLEQMERVYQERGAEAARDYLRNSVKALDGKVKALDKVEKAGLNWLRTESAQFAGERAAVRSAWTDLKKLGEQAGDGELAGLEEQAYSVGAHSVGREIRTELMSRQLYRDYIRPLPVEEQGRILRSGKISSPSPVGTPPQVQAVTATAQRLGVDPRDLAAAISYETGGRFDPNIIGGKGNNYMGLIQFGPEERMKYGVRPGMTFEQQMGSVENFLRDRGVKPGMGISEIYRTINGGNPNAPLTASDGNGTIAQHIERIKSGHYGNADKFLTGEGFTDLMQSPVGVRARRFMVTNLQKDLGQRITDLSNSVKKEGGWRIPDVSEIEKLGHEVFSIGTDEQKQKVAELAAIAEVGAEFNRLSPSQRSTAIANMTERLKRGAPKFERDLDGVLANSHEKVGKLYDTDPYLAHWRYGGGKVTDPVDFANPARTQQTIGERVQQGHAIAADQERPVPSVLRPDEAGAIATTLTQGSVQNAAAVLQTLDGIVHPVNRLATFFDKPMVDALSGMSRSYDPDRMTLAMSHLDKLSREDPQAFDRLFKKETKDRLAAWQTWKDSHSAAEIAERFKEADDPKQSAAREALVKTANEELKALTPKKIGALIEPRWLFAAPLPGDELQQERLKADFDAQYRDLRRQGVSAEKAQETSVERLKQVWGESDVAGQIMRRPPEKYYPMVDGSHDWMRQQVQADIKERRGLAEDESGTGGLTNIPFKLVSDQETEQNISAGQPPSYVVVLTDPETGRPDVLMGTNGAPLRYRFDPSMAQLDSRIRRQAERDLLTDYDATTGNLTRAPRQSVDEAGYTTPQPAPRPTAPPASPVGRPWSRY